MQMELVVVTTLESHLTRDSLKGGERAGGRQTEEIALAFASEPADAPTPSQMRQD